MASTKTDKVNLDVVINGERAGKTLSELNQAQKALSASIRDTKIGSAEYMQQMEKLQKVNDQLKQTRNEIKGVGDQMSHGKQMAMELAGGLGIAFGIEKVIEFGKASFEAFMEAEESAHKLEFALTNITHEGGAFERLNNLAGELQSKTIFDDESIRNTETALIQFGLTADQVEALVPKILDLAAAQGIPLAEATDKVIKGINGQTKGLKTAGLAFDDTGSKVENYNMLLGKLDKFHGAATAATETTAGTMAKFKNDVNDAMEKVGKMLVDIYNRALKPWGEALSSIFNVLGTLAHRLGFTGEKMSGFDVLIKALTKSLEIATYPLRLAAKGVNALAEALGLTEQPLIKLPGLFQTAFDKINQLMHPQAKKQVDLTKLTLAQLKELNTAAAEDEIKRREKLQEQYKKDNEKIVADYKKLLETIDKMEDESFIKHLKDDEREVAAVRLKYQKLYKEAGKHKQAIARLEKLEGEEIEDIRKKQALEKEKQIKEDWEAAIKEAERQSKILTDIEIKNNKDRLDDAAKLAQAKIEIANNLANGLNSLAQLAANQGVESANFMKALALFQIGLDTGVAVSKAISAGAGLLFPANLVAISSGVASVLAGMANASRLLNAAGDVPAYAEGGPTFAKGGHVKKPFMALAGEAGPEWIAPNWMTEDPKLAPVFDILENIRTSKGYAAGGSTASTTTPKPDFAPSTNTAGGTNSELLMAVRQLTAVLQGGIEAKFDYDYFNKAKARADSAKSSAFIG